MSAIFENIKQAVQLGKKMLAVLIDPDKMPIEQVSRFMAKLEGVMVTHIFVGGSTVENDQNNILIQALKGLTKLPIIIFPGDVSQLSAHADALLFLSLVSGRNPDYLIGKQIEAVSVLRNMQLEVIPTGYVLIENGKETAVERVTQTKPLSRLNIQTIIDTSKAAELLGMKCIYLEAGSGAMEPISASIIKAVKNELQIPLFVGGGIRSKKQLENAYNAGADLVVIGTAFEESESFFNELTEV